MGSSHEVMASALFALGLPMVRTIAAPRGGSPHVAVVGRIVCRRRSGFLCCAGKMAVADDSRPLENENEEEVMVRSRGIMWACCVSSALLLGATTASGQVVPLDPEGFMIASPSDMMPSEGGRSVAVYGDSREPGLYVVRITFPPGRGSRPHFHAADPYDHLRASHGFLLIPIFEWPAIIRYCLLPDEA